MSYSSGLTSDSVQRVSRLSAQLSALSVANGLLAQLAADDDFHDRLRDPTVQMAIAHWTQQARLDAEAAQRLNENYNVMFVFQRVNRLQSAFRPCEIKFHFDFVLQRKKRIDLAAVLTYLGEDVIDHPAFPFKEYEEELSQFAAMAAKRDIAKDQSKSTSASIDSTTVVASKQSSNEEKNGSTGGKSGSEATVKSPKASPQNTSKSVPITSTSTSTSAPVATKTTTTTTTTTPTASSAFASSTPAPTADGAKNITSTEPVEATPDFWQTARSLIVQMAAALLLSFLFVKFNKSKAVGDES